MSANIRGAMATKFKPGDPILLGIQADQVSWSEHQPNWIYGMKRRGNFARHERIHGPKSLGEIGLKKSFSKSFFTSAVNLVFVSIYGFNYTF